MARKCDICGKGPMVGYNISHAHNKTKRRWVPNLQKATVMIDGKVRRVNVCAKCLKAGKVQKVA